MYKQRGHIVLHVILHTILQMDIQIWAAWEQKNLKYHFLFADTHINFIRMYTYWTCIYKCIRHTHAYMYVQIRTSHIFLKIKLYECTFALKCRKNLMRKLFVQTSNTATCILIMTKQKYNWFRKYFGCWFCYWTSYKLQKLNPNLLALIITNLVLWWTTWR